MTLLLSLLPAVAAAQISAVAQEPAALAIAVPGQAIEGRLAADDPRLQERGPFRAFRFEASAGDWFEVSLGSADFDTFLTIARLVGGVTEMLRYDDDGGDGTDSWLLFSAPVSGTYVAIAQALVDDGSGQFELLVDRFQPVEPVEVALAIGETRRGTLSDVSAVLEADASRYDLYTFEGRAGEAIVVEMQSDDFDPYLSLHRRTADGLELVTSDDDGGDDLDSRIRLTLADDGEYVVYANSVGRDATGEYVLSLAVAEPSPFAEPRPAALDTPLEGALTSDHPVLDDGTYFEPWAYTALDGERVRITLRSDDFDAFLIVGRMNGDVFEQLDSNDDGGGDTDAELVMTFDAGGVYVIRANALLQNEVGAYTLELSREN